MIATGAVVVSLLTTAAQTYDGYLFYDRQSTRDIETKEIIVPAGQAGKVHNVEWKASVKPMKPPADNKYGPEVSWLQVDITEKVVDESNATMTGLPTNIRLGDRAGRTWVVEIAQDTDRPTDRMEVGKEYKILGAAIVPTAVVNEVELSFRPSTYRSDTPTEKLLDLETIRKLPPETEVLRFRRR
jgi:hypothetical protein